MSNLFNFIKENIKTIGISILIWQFLLTIFCFTTANLVILSALIVVFAAIALFVSYKDDITGFFKK